MTETQIDYRTKQKAQTIFRVQHDPANPYVIMDKRPLENDNLSWRAKGILAYILSRPDNWVVQLRDLLKHSTDGAYAVRAALKELKAAGHLEYRTERAEGHITRWLIVIYENPLLRENQQVEKQQVGNRALNNIEGSLVEGSSTKKERAPRTAPAKKPLARAADFPEVLLVREVTGRYPARDTWDIVRQTVCKVSTRLNRDATRDDLQPFWFAWRKADYNPRNLAWLDWAAAGQVPEKPKGANAHGRHRETEAERAARVSAIVGKYT